MTCWGLRLADAALKIDGSKIGSPPKEELRSDVPSACRTHMEAPGNPDTNGVPFQGTSVSGLSRRRSANSEKPKTIGPIGMIQDMHAGDDTRRFEKRSAPKKDKSPSRGATGRTIVSEGTLSHFDVNLPQQDYVSNYGVSFLWILVLRILTEIAFIPRFPLTPGLRTYPYNCCLNEAP